MNGNWEKWLKWILELSEKLYPNMKMEDLLGCIKMIIEFYENMNKEEDKDVKN